MRDRKDPAGSAETSGRHPNYQRVLTALAAWRDDFAARNRRPGARRRQTDAEAALGLHREWFPDMLKGKVELGLDRLFRYLDLFGVEPGTFFTRAFPVSRDPVAEIVDRLRTIAGPRYATLRTRYCVSPPIFDGEALRQGRSAMAALEILRWEDPVSAVGAYENQVERARSADTRLLGHMLALLAVGLYAVLRRDEAAAAALVALDLATTTGSHLLRSDSLLRASSIAADEGAFDAAIPATLEALASAELDGDQQEIGRCLLLRGILLGRTGNARGALPLYRRAATLVRADFLRFGALQSAGVASLQLGDATEALAYLEGASRLPVPRTARGFASWLRAETAAALGHFNEAATGYAEARTLLDLSHPADWVLVTVQEARALLELGRTEDAIRSLREAVPVAEALSDSGPAAAAKTELLVAAAEGTQAHRRLARLVARVQADSPLSRATSRSVGRRSG